VSKGLWFQNLEVQMSTKGENRSGMNDFWKHDLEILSNNTAVILQTTLE
jgi:hypothetical protein